jgi:lipopolysaccharide transport system ATP-binding protein
MGKMSEVARAGRTILFVSHNAAAVESLCTRGIVLENGCERFSGTQTEALEFYSTSRDALMTCLLERRDREGTAELFITGIGLRNARGETVGALQSGEDATIALQFERRTARDFPRLAARLSVSTQFGAPVFSQANWLAGDSFGPVPERGSLTCQIPKLPLPAGQYRISFQLMDEMRSGRVLDAVQDAAVLPVSSGDFFGSGRTLGQRHGVTLVPGRWRLETSSHE